MPLVFYGPVIVKIMIFLEEPEFVIVMNLFEGPKLVIISSLLGGPAIWKLVFCLDSY